MKKRIICILMALIAVAALFAGCEKKPQPEITTVPSGEGGSDIVEETTAKKPTAQEKLVALTFDDGPHKTYTNRILDILEENHASASFFIVGYNIENNIETIKRIAESGSEVANHSLSHKWLTKLKPEEIEAEVNGPNEIVRTQTGEEIRLFRAPGGHFKGVTDKVGMPLIQWSIDTEDWKFKDAAHKGRTEEQREADLKMIADRVVDEAQKGDIILMHDIYDFTADLCEIVVPRLVEKGFRIVSVSEMYEAYGKELEPGKVYYGIDFSHENTRVVEPGSYKVKTNGGVLNIRQEPKQESVSLLKVANGTPLKVTESEPGWAKVEYNGTVGWVNSLYLEATE